MLSLRKLVVRLLGIACVISVSLLVYIGTLNMTLLNRSTVKHWVSESGIYSSDFLNLSFDNPGAQIPGGDQLPRPSTDALKSVMQKTFPPSYIQKQTESNIDTFYDWLDGTSPSFSASISLSDRLDIFINEMTAAIEPQIAALPVCSGSAQATSCRPANVSTRQMAEELVRKNIASNPTLTKPLAIGSNTSPSPQLPALVRSITPLTQFLIGVLVVSIAGVVLLTPVGHRTHAISQLGRRVFLSQVFSLILALIILWLVYGQVVHFNLPINLPGTANNALAAFVRLAAGDVVRWAAIFSGLACAISLGAWIGGKIWLKHHSQTAIVATRRA